MEPHTLHPSHAPRKISPGGALGTLTLQSVHLEASLPFAKKKLLHLIDRQPRNVSALVPSPAPCLNSQTARRRENQCPLDACVCLGHTCCVCVFLLLQHLSALGSQGCPEAWHGKPWGVDDTGWHPWEARCRSVSTYRRAQVLSCQPQWGESPDPDSTDRHQASDRPLWPAQPSTTLPCTVALWGHPHFSFLSPTGF